MSPDSPVFHTGETVSIVLQKNWSKVTHSRKFFYFKSSSVFLFGNNKGQQENSKQCKSDCVHDE